MLTGCGCTVFVFFQQYYKSWPMMPMHLTIIGVTAFLTVIWLFTTLKNSAHTSASEGFILQITIIVLSLISLICPKDFYLPFIRSISIWSHFFLLFAIPAKAYLIYGGITALALLITHRNHEQNKMISIAANRVVTGYGLLTLSMFSGEIWSYLGWGTPVVWRDPAITTIIATWFYWTCLLHLHTIGSWTVRRRAVFMVVGAMLVLILGLHPDIGPLRAGLL